MELNILFVGASSFTGMWFANRLSRNYNVTCTFTKNRNLYSGLRNKRIKNLSKNIKKRFKICFGDKKFINLISKNNFDIFCFHFASQDGYNSDLSFNFAKSLHASSFNIYKVFKILKERGCKHITYTGSIFEQNEGIPINSKSFNSYGLSKYITSQFIKFFCNSLKLHFKKFVISHPFGEFEDNKLTRSILLNCSKNKIVLIKHPKYIRDFIDIKTLSENYFQFVSNKKDFYLAPRGYACTTLSLANKIIKYFKIYSETNSKIKIQKNSKYTYPIKIINKTKTQNYSIDDKLQSYIKSYLSDKNVKKYS